MGRRAHVAPMGGCCSAGKSDGVELVGYAASGKAGDVSGEGPKRHILRYGGVYGKPAHSQLTSFLLTKQVCRCPSQSTHIIPFSSAVHTASCYNCTSPSVLHSVTPQGEGAGAVPVVRRCRGSLLPSLLWSMGARYEGSSLCRTEMRPGEPAPVGYLRGSSGVCGCSRECEGAVVYTCA